MDTLTSNGPPREITGLGVAGYKSIGSDTYIDIGRLTVLAGPNSAGKSSIMQPLLLVKQSLEAPYDPGPLLLYGSDVKYVSAAQLFSRVPGAPSATLRLTFASNRHRFSTAVHQRGDHALEVSETSYQSPAMSYTLRPRMSQAAIRRAVPQELATIEGLIEQRGRKLTWAVMRNRCFLQLVTRPVNETFISFTGLDASAAIAPAILNVIHVPALRGNPERVYPVTAVANRFPGTFELYAASVIAKWQADRDPRLAQLRAALRALGLTWKVEAQPVNETQVSLVVGRLPRAVRGGARDTVNIVDVGFGVSQTLPVVLALLAGRPGQLVFIEEPEIHLHPRAQQAMGGLLVEAAARGVRVVVETHSSIILRAIQAEVAREVIDPRGVALHWFTRDAAGATQVDTAALDVAGAYGGWPADFDVVDRDVDDAYLDAAEAQVTPQR